MSVPRFFHPKKPEPIHFFRVMRRSNSFSRFSPLVSLRNIFQLIVSGGNTGASTLLLLDLFRTYSKTYDRVANFSKSKRVFSCTLRETCVYETSQAGVRLLQSRLQASTKRTYARDTGPFPNGTPWNKLNWYKMANRIAAEAQAVCNSRLKCTYTHKICLPVFRRTSKMTPGSSSRCNKPKSLYATNTTIVILAMLKALSVVFIAQAFTPKTLFLATPMTLSSSKNYYSSTMYAKNTILINDHAK